MPELCWHNFEHNGRQIMATRLDTL